MEFAVLGVFFFGMGRWGMVYYINRNLQSTPSTQYPNLIFFLVLIHMVGDHITVHVHVAVNRQLETLVQP